MTTNVTDRRGQAKPEDPKPNAQQQVVALRDLLRVLGNLETLLEEGSFRAAHVQALPECQEYVRRLSNDTATRIKNFENA